MSDQRAALHRMRQGHSAARRRQLAELRKRGPDPGQAIAESLSAFDLLVAIGLWPGPRDPVSAHAIDAVRCRWARIQRHAKQGH